MQYLPALRNRRPGLVRSLGLGLLLAGATLWLNTPEVPARPLGDPVEDLRKALKLDPSFSLNEKVREEQLKFRQKNLEEHAEKITSLGDLARALLLQDWRDQYKKDDVYKLDRDVRDKLAMRLENRLREVLKSDSPTPTAWAAAKMISKTAVEARKNSGDTKRPGPGLLVREHLRKLGPDLAELSKRKDDKHAAQAEEARRAAAEALGNIEGDLEKEIIAALENMLANDTPACRRSAADALANIMRILAQPERKNELLQSPLVLREHVVKSGSQVVKVAGKYMHDPDPEVSRLCTDAMLQTATALTDQVASVAPRDRDRFPPPNRKPSQTEYDDMRFYAEGVRQESKDLLPLMKALQESVPTLVKAAQDPKRSDEIRIMVFTTFEQMGAARDKLMQRLESIPSHVADPKDKGAQAAPPDKVRLVGHADAPMPKKLPEDPLLEGLQQAIHQLRGGLEADVPVILAALDALEMLGPFAAEAAPGLSRILTHPDLFVRRASARVLGKIGPVKETDPVPRLAWLLEYDPDLDVRTAAATALERYGASAQGAMPAVLRVVENRRNDAEIRVSAIKTLRGIGTDAAPKGVPVLAAVLSDPDVRVRREAIELIYRFGKEAGAARDALKQAVNDPDLEVSRIASEALLQLGP